MPGFGERNWRLLHAQYHLCATRIWMGAAEGPASLRALIGFERPSSDNDRGNFAPSNNKIPAGPAQNEEAEMKPVVLMLAVIAMTSVAGARAEAQNYPWCAYYGGQMGGSSNCGFVSFQQCLATLSGMGGFCDRNTQYVPPPGPHSTLAYQPPHRRHYPHP
jgi:hypothetical protein